MTQAPVLAMPDFSLPFELEIYASSHAIGAILMQKNHPIAFFSKKMSAKMYAASTYVRELFKITKAVTKWRHYLLRITFIIKTYHQSLKHLITGVNYTIVYKHGKKNNIVDALSRIEEEQEVENLVGQQLLVSGCVYCALTTITSQLF